MCCIMPIKHCWICILGKTQSLQEREFYLRQCLTDYLSNRELTRQIDSCLYERRMLATPKLSTPLRETQPSAAQAFLDN